MQNQSHSLAACRCREARRTGAAAGGGVYRTAGSRPHALPGLLLAAVAMLVTAGAYAQSGDGCGALRIVGGGDTPAVCPLKHTDVYARVTFFLADVTVTQQFENPLEDTIEAVYTFPLPENAAVYRMEMKIGDRVIRGLIKEREEARRIYEAARDAGQAASLLDQERPNVFTQSVANIPPGETVHISIRYTERLPLLDGEYTFAFPMVVGPRYMPADRTGAGGGPVPDANRISPPVIAEGMRAGHDISLTVAFAHGINEYRSVLHEVEKYNDKPPAALTVSLANKKTIPNRDFVLKYRLPDDEIQPQAFTTQDGRHGGFFALLLQPPAEVDTAEITPKEMIFVIDCSGSMRGFPLDKAKKTMRMCIEGMNPGDSFNLVSFAGGTGYCFPKSVANTSANRREALAYLGRLQGGGGTEMMGAIRAALHPPVPDGRLRVVCFMTDGYIGNDNEIIGEVRRSARGARVFSFGIGNSVNRYLIEGMARAGRGAAEVVTLESTSDKAAERFHRRIQSPLLTSITVDFGELPVSDVEPSVGAIPDLFAGEPLVLVGKLAREAEGTVTLRGETAQGPYETQVEVVFHGEQAGKTAGNRLLPQLWARERIGRLSLERLTAQSEVERFNENIERLGLEYELVTEFTSFVAVEERVVREGGELKRIEVPVEMPDGVSYEGVFGEAANSVKALGVAMAPPPSPAVRQSFRAGAPLTGRPHSADSARVAEEAASVTDIEVKPEPSAPRPHAKLAPALNGLSAKLRNGNYSDGDVQVTNGLVTVYLTLKEITEEHLDTLRELGVKIDAVAHSSRKARAKVPVSVLDKLVSLDWLVFVEPA